MKNTFRLPYPSGDLVITRSNLVSFGRTMRTIVIVSRGDDPRECRFETDEEAEECLVALEAWYNTERSQTLALAATNNVSVLVRSKVLYFWRDGNKVVVVMPHGTRLETTCADPKTAEERLQTITDWMNEVET